MIDPKKYTIHCLDCGQQLDKRPTFRAFVQVQLKTGQTVPVCPLCEIPAELAALKTKKEVRAYSRRAIKPITASLCTSIQ